MQGYNRVILIGNLTRDIEVRYTPSGTAVADAGLAVNRKFGNTEEVVFVDITFWGKSAEIAAEYTSKGSPLHVEGRLKMDTWEDKETGKNRSKLMVVAENFTFLGGKQDKSDSEDAPF